MKWPAIVKRTLEAIFGWPEPPQAAPATRPVDLDLQALTAERIVRQERELAALQAQLSAQGISVPRRKRRRR